MKKNKSKKHFTLLLCSFIWFAFQTTPSHAQIFKPKSEKSRESIEEKNSDAAAQQCKICNKTKKTLSNDNICIKCIKKQAKEKRRPEDKNVSNEKVYEELKLINSKINTLFSIQSLTQTLTEIKTHLDDNIKKYQDSIKLKNLEIDSIRNGNEHIVTIHKKEIEQLTNNIKIFKDSLKAEQQKNTQKNQECENKMKEKWKTLATNITKNQVFISEAQYNFIKNNIPNENQSSLEAFKKRADLLNEAQSILFKENITQEGLDKVKSCLNESNFNEFQKKIQDKIRIDYTLFKQFYNDLKEGHEYNKTNGYTDRNLRLDNLPYYMMKYTFLKENFPFIRKKFEAAVANNITLDLNFD